MSPVRTRHLLETLEERIQPSHTALLLVDMQNDYVSPGGAGHRRHGNVDAVQSIIPSLKKLLDAARAAGTLVVFIQMTLDPERHVESDPEYMRRLKRYGDVPMVVRGTWGHEVVSELAPQPGEFIVEKQRSSAFIGTNLDMLLRSNHIVSVVVTGVVTNGCVLATADSARLNDYYVTVVSDGIACARQELHDAALLLLKSSLVLDDSIVPAQRIIDTWAPVDAPSPQLVGSV